MENTQERMEEDVCLIPVILSRFLIMSIQSIGRYSLRKFKKFWNHNNLQIMLIAKILQLVVLVHVVISLMSIRSNVFQFIASHEKFRQKKEHVKNALLIHIQMNGLVEHA